MKKLLSTILLTGFIILVVGSCKKKEDPPDPTPANNVATYQFTVTGNYSDLTIDYLEHGSIKKEVIGPALPWQMILTNFVSGDVASLNVSFKIKADEMVLCSYLIGIGDGTSFSQLIDESSTSYTSLTDTTIHITGGTLVVP